MKRGPLWRISISTLPEAEDAASELLGSHFDAPASSYTDAESGKTSVLVFLEIKPDWVAVRRELQTGLDRIKSAGLQTGVGKLSLEKVRREDWAESWKRHFPPLEISDALLVKPSWSKQRSKPRQRVVILDPGLSFGTGQHPTTRFCLERLARRSAKCEMRNAKLSLLDIGTGSGILAIAAAKLGYEPIEAFDFDPECVRISQANAKRNRVLEKIQIQQFDVRKLPRRTTKRFAVVCANLTADLLISQCDRIVAAMKPAGILLLAGILAKEFLQVRRAYELAGMKLISSRADCEWRSGEFSAETILKKV